MWPADTGGGEQEGHRVDGDRGGSTEPRHLATASAGGGDLTGTLDNLTNGSTYRVKVRARNASGPGPKTEAVPVTLATAPNRPRAVTATAGTSSIAVSWSLPTPGGALITGYTVTADPGPATCTTTGATTCVLGAVAGTAYTVTVVAHSANGDSTLTTDKGQITTAEPRQQITVIGTGFAPHSTATITIYSTPSHLGSVITDGSGDFSAAVTIPAGLPAGAHTVIAQGAAPDGTARAMKLGVTLPAPGAAPGGLPVTGTPAARLTVLGLVLLAVGSGVLLLTRRRWTPLLRRYRRTA